MSLSIPGPDDYYRVLAVETDADLALVAGGRGGQARTTGATVAGAGDGDTWNWDPTYNGPGDSNHIYGPALVGAWVRNTPAAVASVSYNIDDFDGDGSDTPGSEVANDTALLAMQQAAEASGAETWRFTTSGKGRMYRISQNKFLNRILGNHAFTFDWLEDGLRYVYSGPYHNAAYQLFCTPDINYCINASMAYPGLTQALPWPIEIHTLYAGADRCYTINPADALLVDVGEPFAIAGYDRQPGGDPQNFQYCQIGLVCESRDGSTGEIAFKQTVSHNLVQQRARYTFREDWPDHETHNPAAYPNRGRARLYKIVNRTCPPGFTYANMLRSLTVKNVTLAGDYFNHRIAYCQAWDEQNWENVRSNNMFFTAMMARSFKARRVYTPGGEWEVDKLIEVFSADDCEGDSLGGCNIPSVSISNSTFTQVRSQAESTVLTNSLIGPNSSGVATLPVQIDGEAILSGCTINTGSDDGAYMTSYMQSGQIGFPQYVIGSIPAAGQVIFSSPAQYGAGGKPPPLRALLVRTDGSYQGRVTGATGGAGAPGNAITYTVDWSAGATPTAGHAFFMFRDINHSAPGSRSSTGWTSAVDLYAGLHTLEGPPNSAGRTSYTLHALSMPGITRKLVVDVTRAGTPVGATRPRLNIADGDNGAPIICQVDLALTGTRVIRADAVFGAKLHPTYPNSWENLSGYTNLATFWPQLRITFTDLNPDPSLLPQVKLSIYYDPITV